MKVEIIRTPGTPHVHCYLIWCQGCGCPHAIAGGAHFNGDVLRPTFGFAHSYLATLFIPNLCGQPQEYRRCAFLVRDGNITWLPQSNHRLRNQTKALPDFPLAVRAPSMGAPK